MVVNGKEFAYDQRSEEENKKFFDLIESAMDKLQQARSCITYTLFPDLNRSTINALENALGEISNLDYDISRGHTTLFKPVEKEKKYYYRLRYFRGRKDEGNIYIESNFDSGGYSEDEILEILHNQYSNMFDPNDIVKVTSMTESEYNKVKG